MVGLVNGRLVGIEIKRTLDLITSWKTNRLAKQVRLMRQIYDVSVLLCIKLPAVTVSGALWSPSGQYKRTEMGLWEDLLSLQMEGVLIVVCSREELAAKHIKRVLARAGDTDYIQAVYAPSQPERLLHMTGVGVEREGRLIKHFGSVARLACASTEEVMQVSGFGPKLAEEVIEWFNRKR